ncbi:MAG: hypothetical protein ACKV2T_06140 [Kofleriaceae bacterium]
MLRRQRRGGGVVGGGVLGGARPELASIAGKVVTKVGDGTYRVELVSGSSKLFIVKAGGAWAAALTIAPTMFDLGLLIPKAVLGDAKVSDGVLVIAGGSGTIDGAAHDLISVEEVELSGSLRKLRGQLEVTIAVGDTDVERSYELALGPGALDVMDLAEDIADEITEQATKKDSEVWKLLRKGKK